MIIATAALVGLLCGSFTNVLIARIPQGEEWVRTPSRCPHCKENIAWYDNVPLISWVVLNRRCRHCGVVISARYPLVELTVAVLFALVAWVHGISVPAFVLAYLAVVTVALAAIDLEHRRLPNALVLPSMVVVAVGLAAHSAVEGEWWILARGGLGAVILAGFYFLLWFAYPKGLGFGDVKTAVFLGLALGMLGWPELAVGAIAGPLLGGVGAVWAIMRARRVRDVRLAYGPALLGGAWIGFLVGEQIANGYINWVLSWN